MVGACSEMLNGVECGGIGHAEITVSRYFIRNPLIAFFQVAPILSYVKIK